VYIIELSEVNPGADWDEIVTLLVSGIRSAVLGVGMR
jgi:hypothetical protein